MGKYLWHVWFRDCDGHLRKVMFICEQEEMGAALIAFQSDMPAGWPNTAHCYQVIRMQYLFAVHVHQECNRKEVLN